MRCSLTVTVLSWPVQVLDALSELAHRQSGDGRQAVVVGADPERRTGRDEVSRGQVPQAFAQLGRCGRDQRPQLVQGLGAGLVRAALHHLQRPQRLDRAVVGLGRGGRLAGQHGAGGGDRVDDVGLAVPAADLPVRAGRPR
jgi:hypothetical protein